MRRLKWSNVITVVVAAFAGATPTQARWLRAETPHFIFYSEESEEDLRKRASELEGFHIALRILTATTAPPVPTKLSIYVVNSNRRMNQIMDVASYAAGIYLSSPDGIATIVNQSSSPDRNSVLFHEYAHHFMFQYHPAGYPRWYGEGFADYMGSAKIEPGVAEIGHIDEPNASLLGTKINWIPLGEILTGSFSSRRWNYMGYFYAQSWLLVHYLMRDASRTRQLSEYLVATGAGEPPLEAFPRIFGMTPEEMQRRLIEYSGTNVAFNRLRGRMEPPQITISAVPGDAGYLLLRQASMRFGDAGSSEMTLERIRRDARGHDSPFARRVLAEAEARYGDAAVAERLLDELLTDNPADAELLYLRGLPRFYAARRNSGARAEHLRLARSWFVRAHRADPNHYPSLYRYAEAMSVEPNFISENMSNVLVLAHQLAPQVREIRLNAALMLLMLERYGEAEALLEPLAVDPHAARLATSAQGFLQKARTGTKQDVPAPFSPAVMQLIAGQDEE